MSIKRFRLSTLLLLMALVAVAFGWYFDRKKLQAEYDAVNAEASALFQNRIKGNVLLYPPERQQAKSAWWFATRRRGETFDFDTPAGRRQVQKKLSAVLAGVGGFPVQIKEGTSKGDVLARLLELDFKIDKNEPELIIANKNTKERRHVVTLELRDDRVVKCDDRCWWP